MLIMPSRDALSRGSPPDDEYADAIDFLASGAGASRSEYLVIQAMIDAFKIFSRNTSEHSARMGLHVKELSSILGVPDRDAFRFGLFACLHDAGKIGVPITLLDKPGKFSNEERALVETHVLAEFACLDHFEADNRKTARQIIRSHHENYDGTGYPDGLAGNLIPTAAQICRICDFFDAVHSDRPYRKGMSRKETLDLMQKNASAFNPEFFRAFVGNIDLVDCEASLQQN